MACKLKNNFATKNLSKLYLNDEYSDVKFVIQNEEIPANKIILAVASPVFRAMFYGPMKEEDIVQINDADVDAGAFKEFLQLFYLDEVELSMKNIEIVTRLADKYDVLDCLKTFSAYHDGHMNELNEINLCAYEMAIALENEKLREFCETRISIDPLDIFHSEAFLRCDEKVLKSILLIDSLNCKEIHVLKACLEWAKHSCRRNGLDENNAIHLKAQLGECFYLIRFSAMKAEEVTALIAEKSMEGLFSQEEFVDAIYATTMAEFQPKIFKQKLRSVNFDPILSASKRFTCGRELVIYDENYYRSVVQKPSDLCFSTNIEVLLWKIDWMPVLTHVHPKVVGNIIIFEVENTESAPIVEDKVTLDVKSSSIILKQPVLIKPNRWYCVRLNLTDRVYIIMYT